MKERLVNYYSVTKRYILRYLSLFIWFKKLFHRRLSSKLTKRIAILNLAGLVALFLGFLWINQTRIGVIDARSQSLSLQSELIATAIANTIPPKEMPEFDPDQWLSQQILENSPALPSPFREDPSQDWLEFSINPALAAPILKRLVIPTRTRARIYDQYGVLLLDTKALHILRDLLTNSPIEQETESTTLFSRAWNGMRQKLGMVFVGNANTENNANQEILPEVLHALHKFSSTWVRVTSKGTTILYAASPIQRDNHIKGALLLSTEEGDVDLIIDAERTSLLHVFLVAATIMFILSILLAGTIAEPVRSLSEAADRVRRGIRKREEIPDLSYRSDEIGQLSSSLRDMTEALYSRIEAIEHFAADVAHELKNPLTSLRSAVETFPLVQKPEIKERLTAIILHDVKRLNRLITDISEASRLDAELQREDVTLFDLSELIQNIVAMRHDISDDENIILSLPEDKKSIFIYGHDSRITQVICNILDNARSFSPPKAPVRINLSYHKDNAEINIDDEGQGIPDHSIKKIFDRFYTDRPTQNFGQNSGLGLSISKQIIEAHNGIIYAENLYGENGEKKGARFVIKLPLAKIKDSKS